jgi:hypothetical protein
VVQLVVGRIEHDAYLRASVLDIRDRDVPIRNPAQEIVRAVDRIDDPAAIDYPHEVSRRFLPEKSFVRERTRQIEQNQPRDPRNERTVDAVSANEISRLQRIQVAQFEFALLRLMIELREYSDLDGAGRGKHFIGVEQIFLPGREIKDGNAEYAVKIVVNSSDRRLELLPQDLLLLLGSFFLRNLLRAGRHRGAGCNGEQREEENSFWQGDLRVSGIIRRKRISHE